MNDMSAVIVPKSDQINAEDFIAGPRTFTIEGVAISPGTEQPVSIKLSGEQRVFRPCKSMSRVLVGGWGPDANAYIGRSLTLYRDPKVKWGGLEVGGIRISHMSHIERDMVMSLTATKGKRAPHQVKVLQGGARQPQGQGGDRAASWAQGFIRHIAEVDSIESLTAAQSQHQARIDELREKRPELAEQITVALTARADELANPAVAEKRADADMGEEFADDGFGGDNF